MKSSWRSPTPTVRCVSQNASYDRVATFAQTIAATVASSRMSAPIRFCPIARIFSAIERRVRDRATTCSGSGERWMIVNSAMYASILLGLSRSDKSIRAQHIPPASRTPDDSGADV